MMARTIFLPQYSIWLILITLKAITDIVNTNIMMFCNSIVSSNDFINDGECPLRSICHISDLSFLNSCELTSILWFSSVLVSTRKCLSEKDIKANDSSSTMATALFDLLNLLCHLTGG